MSSQRPPISTRASGEYNNNEGQHPSDDLLLAYVRRQHLDNWIEIEQHVKLCPFCRETCHAFQHSSALISAWVEDKGQQLHPSVANLVTRRIALESRLSPGERVIEYVRQACKYSVLETVVQRILGQEDAPEQATAIHISPLSPLSDEPLPGPFAELQRQPLPGGALRSGTTGSQRGRSLKKPAIALVVAAAVFTVVIGLVVSPRILPGYTAEGIPPKTINVPHQNSTPTQQKASPTPSRPASDPLEPQISLCSDQGQIKHNVIRICGYGFTPDGRVWLTVYGPQSMLFLKSANADGSIDLTFNLNSCRTATVLILVVDDSSHKVAKTSNITLGGCLFPGIAEKHRK